MRGNQSNTISPFILFSVHNPKQNAEGNEVLTNRATRSLTRQKVPFKRVSLLSKGGKLQENQIIVDASDDLVARELAGPAGQDTFVTVDPNRVGTRVFVNKFNTGSTILGVLESVLEHSLDPGDIYLKDEAGTCWAWK